LGKYFGTDGIRGAAGDFLTARLAMDVGQAAAAVLRKENGRPRVYIGKDTRGSGDMLEAAVAAGLCAGGADAVLLGVAPTPAVAYLTARDGADAGIVLSASHNPAGDNGIKIFNRDGVKLPEAGEAEIEALIEGIAEAPPVMGDGIGRITHEPAAIERYIDHIAGTVEGGLSGLRVAVDCAHGAAVATAQPLFARLGAECGFFFDAPDGNNINEGCGSTDLKALGRFVRDGGYDCGVALDGDADRCLVVDENGRPVDGDHIMALCAVEAKRNGSLAQDTLVATVMSNMGFLRFCRHHGIHVETTPVGDKYVLERMLAEGYTLGGEQSGHIIFRRYVSSGDGQLTAVQFLSLLKRQGRPLSELTGAIPSCPQVLLGVTVNPLVKETVLAHPAVQAAVLRAEKALGTEGRVLVRASGTEPLVRVMVEGWDGELVNRLAGEIEAVVRDAAG
jgi:phosphoglucosamine mutase